MWFLAKIYEIYLLFDRVQKSDVQIFLSLHRLRITIVCLSFRVIILFLTNAILTFKALQLFPAKISISTYIPPSYKSFCIKFKLKQYWIMLNLWTQLTMFEWKISLCIYKIHVVHKMISKCWWVMNKIWTTSCWHEQNRHQNRFPSLNFHRICSLYPLHLKRN